jgi:N-acetylmuramoyl-L-alanine amidase
MVPFRLVPVAVGIAVAAFFVVGNSRSQSGNPRIAQYDEGYTRFVLETPRSVKFASQVLGRGVALRLIGLKPSELKLNGTDRTVDTKELISWALEGKGSDSLLTLKTTYAPVASQGYRAFTLPPQDDTPNRLVIDLGPKVASGMTAKAASSPPTPNTPTSNTSSPRKPVNVARAPQRPDPVVVLDPGHGGVDYGMIGYVTEKYVTLDIGLKLREILQAKGVKVVMTRSGDKVVQQNGSIQEKRRDLDARAQMASTDRNVFVSIHVNSAAPEAQGVETFVFGEPLEARTLKQAERENGGGSIGRALTQQLREASSSVINRQLIQENLRFSSRLAQAVQSSVVNRTGAASRGVDQAYFWVIRYARIPAILVETGFGTNPTEGTNLSVNAYRLKVAQGIADGIFKFLNIK